MKYSISSKITTFSGRRKNTKQKISDFKAHDCMHALKFQFEHLLCFKSTDFIIKFVFENIERG